MNLPKRDFKGQKLCESCWNGRHYIAATRRKACDHHKKHRIADSEECADCTWVKTGTKITNCSGGDCECNCRELLAEKHPRIKPDYSDQVTIAEVVGDDVIQVGNREHRDEG